MPSHLPPSKPVGLSARGLSWRKRARGPWIAYWVARRDLVDKGYKPASARLWPPTEGDRRAENQGGAHGAPTPTEWLWIAGECERRQNEMHAWVRQAPEQNPLLRYNGTLKSLIDVYQLDKDSPYHAVRFMVRRSYDSKMRTLVKAVGKARLAQLTFRDFKRWYENFRCDQKDQAGRTVAVGPSTERAHGLIAMLRILFGYGALAELDHCGRLKAVLSAQEFPRARPRTQYMTAEYATAIRREAHKQGRPSLALAQAIMFELGLRQKDVIGEWIPIDDPGISAITYHGKKWVMGLDWREVSPDLILRHRLSKSVRGRLGVIDPTAGKTEEWDLKEYPMIMEELTQSRCGGGWVNLVGPMIVAEQTGRPWTRYFADAWREVARAAGVPDDVQNRDSRAGAATEADRATNNRELVQNALGHSKVVTTEGYIREKRTKRTELQRERVKGREGK